MPHSRFSFQFLAASLLLPSDLASVQIRAERWLELRKHHHNEATAEQRTDTTPRAVNYMVINGNRVHRLVVCERHSLVRRSLVVGCSVFPPSFSCSDDSSHLSSIYTSRKTTTATRSGNRNKLKVFFS